MTEHRIFIGDSRRLNFIRDEEVHLIITSPPYWQLKDYGNEKQIGFHDSYEEYINNLNHVWAECYRVLAPGCRMCINIGDQFARSVYYGRYKVIPIRTEIIKFCECIGMDYMGAIIWQKATTMNTTGGGAVMGSFPYPRNGILKIDYEFILIFKKLGKSPNVTKEQKLASQMSREEWNQYFASHWNFNGVKQDNHIAMFPEELPKRLIKMFSFVGETVFDPFLGSGTTSLAAKKLNRNSVGYEINSDFIPVIKKKIDFFQNELFNESSKISFFNDNIGVGNLCNLPYVFNDPHKFVAKVDMKKLSFGSVIDGAEQKNNQSLTVNKIISPEIIELNNGLCVRMIGVKTLSCYLEDAILFLNNHLLKKHVFLKYDERKYDENGVMLVYLYLKNKTFINKHLLRTGFVEIDTSYDYKYQNVFLQCV